MIMKRLRALSSILRNLLIAVILVGLCLAATGCAAQSGFARRIADLGLGLHDSSELAIVQEHESGGANTTTITARDNGATMARVRIMNSVPPQQATQYITEQTVLLQSIFESKLPPYPEFLTRDSGCPAEFKPVERSNRLGSYYVLFAGERFGYGVCTDDLASRRAAIGHFYCPQSQRLFTLEYFIPRDSEEKTLYEVFESISCQ